MKFDVFIIVYETYCTFHFPYLQQERDRLLAEIENLAANSDGQAQKLQDVHAHKLKSLEAQVCRCLFLED